ncbi:unnamed protein product [Heterosigma akashiwo]
MEFPGRAKDDCEDVEMCEENKEKGSSSEDLDSSACGGVRRERVNSTGSVESRAGAAGSAVKRRRLQNIAGLPAVNPGAIEELAVECSFAMTVEEKAAYFDRMQEVQRQQQLCDLTLRVQGVEFPCHRSVLMGHQCFLQAMLESGMKEARQAVIDLDEPDPSLFGRVLDYLYGRPVALPSTEVVGVLELASRYGVEGLAEQAAGAGPT